MNTWTCERCGKTVKLSTGGYPATHKALKSFTLPDGTPFQMNVRCTP